MKSLSNKLSFFAIAIIMGAIIVSFLFTGFTGFGGSPGEAASVDGSVVTTREYDQALQQNIARYTDMLKAKTLTNQQIKMFRLRENTLNGLISQKHILNFATKLDFDAGKLDIKNAIKEYKVFQTGGKFDVIKYKSILTANKLSATKFEEDIINQVKTQKLGLLMGTAQDSKEYTKELFRLKNLQMNVTAVTFDKEEMTKNIKISSTERKSFTADKKNDVLLKGLYKSYEAEAKNTKKKVKSFKKMASTLATKHLQKTKREELTKFNAKLMKDIKHALSSSNVKKLNSLKKKYGIDFDKKHEMSPFELTYMGTKLEETEALALLKSQDSNKVLTVDTATKVLLVKANKFTSKKVSDKDLGAEITASVQKNGQLLQGAILKFQEKSSKVTTNESLFL